MFSAIEAKPKISVTFKDDGGASIFVKIVEEIHKDHS
jgi:hypothetical protein